MGPYQYVKYLSLSWRYFGNDHWYFTSTSGDFYFVYLNLFKLTSINSSIFASDFVEKFDFLQSCFSIWLATKHGHG